jgi:hypothetical protein
MLVEELERICDRNISKQGHHIETDHDVVWLETDGLYNLDEINGVLHVVSRAAGEWPEKSCQELGKRVSRCTSVVDCRPQRDAFFMEPVGRSC